MISYQQETPVMKMQLTKVCRKCNTRKANFLFNNNKRFKDGLNCYCKKCESYRRMKSYYMQKNKSWTFPWKSLKDEDYIKTRDKFFAEAHGWWCNDGRGWGFELETRTEYFKRKRAERRAKRLWD